MQSLQNGPVEMDTGALISLSHFFHYGKDAFVRFYGKLITMVGFRALTATKLELFSSRKA